MPWIDAFIEHEAKHTAQVLHDTWGHLEPKPQTTYRGWIVFSVASYDNNETSIVDEDFEGIPGGGPGWYMDLHNFIGKKRRDPGVYRFDGTYRMMKNGKGRFTGKVTVVWKRRTRRTRTHQ